MIQIFKPLVLLSLFGVAAHARVASNDALFPLALYVMALIAITALFFHMKQLKKSERLSKLLFEHAPKAMFVVNSKHKIIRINHTLTSLLKTSQKHLLGALWYERFLPDETALVIRHKLHQKQNEHLYFEVPYVLPDGSIKLIDFNAQKLPFKLTLFSCEAIK